MNVVLGTYYSGGLDYRGVYLEQDLHNGQYFYACPGTPGYPGPQKWIWFDSVNNRWEIGGEFDSNSPLWYSSALEGEYTPNAGQGVTDAAYVGEQEADLRCAGDTDPDAAGVYEHWTYYDGVMAGQQWIACYRRMDGEYFIYFTHDDVFWKVATSLGANSLWLKFGESSVLGNYSPNAGEGAFGIAVIILDVPYTLTSSAGTGGSISPSGATIVDYGEDQSFIATPATGYIIGNWTVDGVVVHAGGTTHTFNDITADHTIAIAFTALSARHFCTLADVKTRLGISNADYDAVIQQIIDGIDSRFNNYHPRRKLLMTDSDVTEFYGIDSGLKRLLLRQYPVISITEIKEASDFDFDGADALVVNDDYRLVNAGLNGIVYRVYNYWLAGEDVIRVTYRGGYCGAGEAASAGEYALPDELREKAIEQASFVFKRKDDIGLSSVSVQGGSISKFADMELLPDVKQVLEKYKPPSL